jgi:hypothetical protein
MDEATQIPQIESVNSGEIVRKRLADSSPPPTKRRRFDPPDSPESPSLRSTNVLFQSPGPTEDRENGDVISDQCDMMEDVQNDPLADLFSQVIVGKEYDHIAWNGDDVCRRYSALTPNNDRTEDELLWDIGYVRRLLPLFVVTIRPSSEMLPEMLLLKAHQYDPLGIS